MLYKVKIVHSNFLEVGHTQSAGDSMYACIENYTKHKKLYTQQQWGNAMAASCVKRPYEVIHLKQSGIYDFKIFSSSFKWRSVAISNVREIIFDPSMKSSVRISYDFEKITPANIFKTSNDYESLVENFVLSCAYDKKLQLPPKKQQDLKTMVEKNWISPRHHDFYLNIVA
ncbi:hypothetical protein TKK_0009514 [Trichogramma kaykai]